MTQPLPSCYTQDNTRADGLSGAQIYSLMTSGPGTGSAQAGANAAAGLERTYAGIEARLKRVGETLGEAWTGASADAAQAAGNPINQAMIQMQDSLRQADHSLSNQVYQFNLNKGQLKNMPADKPDTNLWDDVTPWDTDTEDAVNSYNSQESHNRKVYSEFQSASNTNRGDLPREFPGVTTDNLQVEVVNTGGDDGRDKTGNGTPGRTGTTNTSGLPNSTGSPQGPDGTWTPPGTLTGGDRTDTSGVGPGDGGTGGGNKPGDLTGRPPIGSVIERPPNTGIPPIGVPVGPGLGGGGTGRGPGGGGTGRGPGGGPGGGAGGKLGGGAGSGRFGGGGLGGVGAGGTAAQQPGGKAGVFGAMGETGPNAGARGGAAGAAGRAGAAGMGGMGGHGQKGQGEDDLEHKSADYLVTEENTNELIGDMPMVAPPTIGG